MEPWSVQLRQVPVGDVAALARAGLEEHESADLGDAMVQAVVDYVGAVVTELDGEDTVVEYVDVFLAGVRATPEQIGAVGVQINQVGAPRPPIPELDPDFDA